MRYTIMTRERRMSWRIQSTDSMRDAVRAFSDAILGAFIDRAQINDNSTGETFATYTAQASI